jgi:plasmid maintenance system killer protein
MAFTNLPRDIQLSIIQKFDIDTRIKTNVIHKLQVPVELSIKLNSLNLKRKLSFELRVRDERTHIVTLKLSPTKHYECYYNDKDNMYSWYYVDLSSATQNYGFPYLLMLYPPPRQRMLT